MSSTMGTLHYGGSEAPIHIEERALAHLKVIVATKLRRNESFTLSWRTSPRIVPVQCVDPNDSSPVPVTVSSNTNADVPTVTSSPYVLWVRVIACRATATFRVRTCRRARSTTGSSMHRFSRSNARYKQPQNGRPH